MRTTLMVASLLAGLTLGQLDAAEYFVGKMNVWGQAVISH